MHKYMVPVLVAGAVLLVGAGVFVMRLGSVPENTVEKKSVTFFVPEEAGDNASAPLPTGEDAVRLFFSLIEEHKVDEAITMMTAELRGGEETEALWRTQFTAIRRIKPQNVEPWEPETWQDGSGKYRTMLDVVVDDSADAPIPNYGWGDNPNIRWVSTARDTDGVWRITDIATGP